MKNLSPNRRGDAFTLVELLVVISIISLLIAILLPSLKKARDIARNTQCLSQLRQNGIGVFAYSTDFKDRIPIHWGRGLVDGILHQHGKLPSNTWIIYNNYGHIRGGALFPHYLDGRTFYCPTDPVYFFDRRVHAPGGYGLGHYPWTGWSGTFYVSYAFPAVAQGPIATTEYGGRWTGAAPNYWVIKNATTVYSLWKDAMLWPTVDENARDNLPMMWDTNGMHDFKTANVTWFDGSTSVFGDHEEAYNTVYSGSIRGMGHPSIMTWLKSYRSGDALPW